MVCGMNIFRWIVRQIIKLKAYLFFISLFAGKVREKGVCFSFCLFCKIKRE
jgi:hypothetical protein